MKIFRPYPLLILLSMLTTRVSAQESAEQMPILRITCSELRIDSFTPGSMDILTADSGRINVQVRHRGNSSLSMSKPSLAIKTVDALGQKMDISLFGMREDNYWVLDAMAIDKARARNRASMDLWLEMARVPWYQSQEPECLNGYRGKMVDVYLNDQHMGIYHLSERIDRKQLKLKKYSATKGGIRGLLYRMNDWSALDPFGSYIRPYPEDTTDTWRGWGIEYPKMEDGEPVMWQPAIDLMEFVRTHPAQTIYPDINSYIDMPVYTDYILFINMLCAQDNRGKNTYWSYYDRNLSTQALVSIWDIDHSWGRRYDGTEERTNTLVTNQIINKLLANSEYKTLIRERYAELRQNILTVQHLDSLIGRYLDLYAATGMDRVEEQLWDGIDGVALDIRAERALIHRWLVKRLAYLDSYFRYQIPPYPVGGITTTTECFTEEEKDRCQRLNPNDGTMTIIFSPKRFDVAPDSIVHSIYAYGTVTAWRAPLEEYKLPYFSADSCFYTTLPLSMLDRPGNVGQPEIDFRIYYEDYVDAETPYFEPMPLDSGAYTVDPRLNLHDGGIMLVRPEDDIDELGTRIAKKWDYRPLSAWNLSDTTEQKLFANFRLVPGTRNLYRSFHPYYPIISDETAAERVHTVARCAERAGVASAICLSGDHSDVEGMELPCGDSTFIVHIPPYYRSLMDNQHILYVGQAGGHSLNYQNTLWFVDSELYGEWFAEIVDFVCDTTNHVPFQIHCSLGAERTGAFSAVIAALCGSTWEQIATDFEATYLTRCMLFRHRGLIAYTLTQMLGAHPADIPDLRESMWSYLLATGAASAEELTAFVARLQEQHDTPTRLLREGPDTERTAKRIVGGRLIIERNGHRYTPLGHEVQ